MFLLDTNVISELRKAKKGTIDKNVASWAATVPADRMYLSAVTILELEYGVLLLERRDPAQGARLRLWLDYQVLPVFAERILAVDTNVALRCAKLHIPNRGTDRDTMIAATGLVYGLTVVTRNLVDFSASGVATINPWE